MPIPQKTLKAYEKTRVDLAIEAFAQINEPTTLDLHKVKTQGHIQDWVD